MDVIRCHGAGLATAIAPMGTAFSAEHARMLKRYVDGVIIAFDSDDAGRNAAMKTAALFLEAGVAVVEPAAVAPGLRHPGPQGQQLLPRVLKLPNGTGNKLKRLLDARMVRVFVGDRRRGRLGQLLAVAPQADHVLAGRRRDSPDPRNGVVGGVATDPAGVAVL